MAWVFFGLTTHTKNNQFERTVEALIFTGFILPLHAMTKWVLQWAGEKFPIMPWTETTSLATSIVLAVFLGLVFAYCNNSDCFHALLRHLKITTRTAYPTQWFGMFRNNQRWVVLHLTGPNGRRLYGQVDEWADNPESGHIAVRNPRWLNEDGSCVPFEQVDAILVRVTDVEMVEFVRDTEQPPESQNVGQERTGELQQIERVCQEQDSEGGAAPTSTSTDTKASSSSASTTQEIASNTLGETHGQPEQAEAGEK